MTDIMEQMAEALRLLLHDRTPWTAINAKDAIAAYEAAREQASEEATNAIAVRINHAYWAGAVDGYKCGVDEDIAGLNKIVDARNDQIRTFFNDREKTEAQARAAERWRAVRSPVDAVKGDPYIVVVGRHNVVTPVLLDEADSVADAAIAKQKG